MNIKRLAARLLFGLSVISTATQAQTVITFQDDDVDFLLTSALAPKTGDFAVGDVLVSVFEMPEYTINGVNQIPAGQQVTGLAVLQIESIVGNTVTFEAYSGGFNAVSPVDVAGGGAGGGVTAGFWLHATNLDLSLASAPAVTCISLLQCSTLATMGTLIQTDGFAGDPDEFWTASGLIAGAFNTNTVLGTSGGLNVALFNFAQTTFFNSTGAISGQNILTGLPCVTVGADGCVAGPVGTGTVQGGGGPTPLNAGIVADGAFARSDADLTKLQAVPEPGILTLLGMVLLGLGATRRRRQ